MERVAPFASITRAIGGYGYQISTRDAGDVELLGMFCRAGKSSRCKDPAPTVGIAGRVLRSMALPDIYAIAGINRNGIEVDSDAACRVDYVMPVALIYGDAAGALPCDAVCVFNDAARRVATYS